MFRPSLLSDIVADHGVLLIAGAAAILLVFLQSMRTATRGQLLPPGPKPAFLIGNLLDLPKEFAADCYIKWGKKYNSDILYASAFGTHIIVLNKFEDAEALLERRSSKYSNRVDLPIVKLMGWEGNMGFIPTVGAKWRKHRRLAQQHFHLDANSMQQNVQLSGVRATMRALLDTPEDFANHIKVMAISIPLVSMYGRNISTLDDEYIVKAERSMALGGKLLLPGYTLINTFPILGRIPPWVPGATAQKMAHEAKTLYTWITRKPLEQIKIAVKNGTAAPSVISDFLRNAEGKTVDPTDEDDLADIAAAVYGGAIETMISTTHIMIYLLLTHPHIQKAVQSEIDTIVGRDRLPTLGDRESMPYSEAVYRELMRWSPSTRLGIPHCTSEDDTYKGYFIPKGTVVFGNICNTSRSLAYGFGNRICPGRYSAGATLWLMLTTLMACFNITKAKDADGREIEVNDEFQDSTVTSHKLPFKCSFNPRSSSIGKLVDESMAPVN